MIKLFRYKTPSGALQFTLFIGVIISLLLVAVLLYAKTFSIFKEKSKKTIENVQLTNLGIEYLLRNSSQEDSITIPIDSKSFQVVSGHYSQWGIFGRAYVKSSFRKQSFSKTALIGSCVDSMTSPSLYLPENSKPLILIGDTKIRGIAYLSSAGVRPGFFSGEGYRGKELIYGSIKESRATLPPFSSLTLDNIAKSLSAVSKTDELSDLSGRNLFNSFKKKTREYHSVSTIILENVSIKGNIIIRSDTLIRIKSTAVLQDVIIIAPFIEMENNTIGAFQAIATKKISVGDFCRFNYPSSLVIYYDQESTTHIPRQIIIGQGSEIKGAVCYFDSNQIENFDSNILLEKSATIKGQVYCQGNFELNGSLLGSVYTNQFITHYRGAVYINHLYNTKIGNNDLPSQFAGILLKDDDKKVMKWLY